MRIYIVLVLALHCSLYAFKYKNIQLLDYNSCGSGVSDSVMCISCWGYENNGSEYALICKGLYYDFEGPTGFTDQCSLMIYQVSPAGELDFIKGYRTFKFGEEIAVFKSDDDSIYAFISGHGSNYPINGYEVYIYNLSSTSTSIAGSLYSDAGVHGVYVDQNEGVLFLAKTFDTFGALTKLSMYYLKTSPDNPRLFGQWTLPDYYDWVIDYKDNYKDSRNAVGFTESFTTGSTDSANYRIYIAGFSSGFFIGDLDYTKANDTLVTLSVDTANTWQFEYRCHRDTAGPDSDYVGCHSVWVSDDNQYLFVGGEVNHQKEGNPWGPLHMFHIPTLLTGAVNVNHGDSPNFRKPYAIYDVEKDDDSGHIYTNVDINLSQVDSANTCIHYFQLKDGMLYISYYTKGLRIIDVSDTSNIKELGYWDIESSFDYTGDDPDWPWGTYGPHLGTYGVYGLLPSGIIITSSHDGIRTFRYARMGTLAVNETWEDTVIVFGDVVVPAGCTLTINAGCVIKFQELADSSHSGTSSSLCELVINGTLIANGTASNPVIFTSDASSPSPADWYGIVCSDGNVTMDNSVIEYAYWGVYTKTSADGLVMDSCTIRDADKRGIYVSAGTASIKNSIIEDINNSSAYGIYISSGCTYSWIEGNTIENIGKAGSSAFGIRIASDYATMVKNNIIQDMDNGSVVYGIYDYSGNATYIWNNQLKDFDGSGSYGIYVSSALSLSINGNRIENADGSFAKGIYLSSVSYSTVSDDTVYNCSADGIDNYNSSNMVIEDNIIGDCNGMNSEAIVLRGSSSDNIDVEDNYIQADTSSYSAYIGISVADYAEGTIRRNTIEDFYNIGIASYYYGVADCGTAVDSGKNDIYWNFNGDSVCAGSYFLANSGLDTMNAKYNYFGSSSPSSSCFDGLIYWTPYLTSKSNPKAAGYPSIPEMSLTKITEKKLYVEPNPFKLTPEIFFELEKSNRNDRVTNVVLVIYDAHGKQVKKLADQPMRFGKQRIKWDGTKENGQKAEAGMYYVTLNYLEKSITEKFYKLK